MKLLKFIFLGFIFGVVLTKTEAISWYRIYEMFYFQSFHMYGVIFTAVFIGVIGVQLFKKKEIKGYKGAAIEFVDKEKTFYRYFIGGIMFGLGWALVGCCPGPIFVLLGAGIFPVIVVLLGALLGNILYGILRNKLPH